MMKEFEIGCFVQSMAGHDSGKCYVIYQIDQEYIYLVDGKIRTLDRPKRKKKKHVVMLASPDPTLAYQIINGKVKDEEIKRALKLLQVVNSSKEA